MKNNVSINSIMSRVQTTAFNKTTGSAIWHSKPRPKQHFFPLTERDYCEAVKRGFQYGIDQMPILSISAKDYPYCDFNCIDCLACPSREWALTDNHIKYPIIPLDTYKKILKDIAKYSSDRGCDSVRFEFCGEGNPDLYKDRIQILEHANQECNMGIVYVSTGSCISDDLLKSLVENASFIRISFPGISPDAYKYYSNQRSCNQFTYNDALLLLDKLCNERAKLGREDSLMLGTRTCIRPLNAGHYTDFIRTISEMGIDAFQGVKVLVPDFESVKNEIVTDAVIDELLDLPEVAHLHGLKNFQIPSDLKTVFKERVIEEKDKAELDACWSSIVSPPMYGTNLMCCVLWDKITDLNYHYGILDGTPGEIEKVMHSERAKFIAQNCPHNCKECPSINDNNFMQSLWRALSRNENDINNIVFVTNYN